MVTDQSLSAAFGALADITRRRIIERLARGPLTVGQIAAAFPISQPAISRHVRVLETSGLVNRRIEGRVHRLTLAPEGIAMTSAWLERQRTFWAGTLDKLDLYLKATPKRRKRS
jgi:DNA-binding transcriptional ArsR family regulator